MLGIFWLVRKPNGKGKCFGRKIEVVAGAGIEPATQGFSVLLDTHFLHR
jgi:hypothetical protein